VLGENDVKFGEVLHKLHIVGGGCGPAETLHNYKAATQKMPMKQLSRLIHLKRYRRKFPQNLIPLKIAEKKIRMLRMIQYLEENSIVGFVREK